MNRYLHNIPLVLAATQKVFCVHSVYKYLFYILEIASNILETRSVFRCSRKAFLHQFHQFIRTCIWHGQFQSTIDNSLKTITTHTCILTIAASNALIPPYGAVPFPNTSQAVTPKAHTSACFEYTLDSRLS